MNLSYIKCLASEAKERWNNDAKYEVKLHTDTKVKSDKINVSKVNVKISGKSVNV